MKVGIEGGLIVAFDVKEHRLLENGVIVFEGKKIIHVGKSYSGARASKIIEREASVATSIDLFNSATISGANALHRKDLGRIAVGCKADLVFIRLDTFNMSPYKDPIRNFVQLSESSDVARVIVDGETLVKDGKVLWFDEIQNFEAMQRSMNKICERIPENDRIGRTVDDLMAPMIKKWGE